METSIILPFVIPPEIMVILSIVLAIFLYMKIRQFLKALLGPLYYVLWFLVPELGLVLLLPTLAWIVSSVAAYVMVKTGLVSAIGHLAGHIVRMLLGQEDWNQNPL